ncbi:MAG TPA: PAS domain S-box protein, partial [Pyrinomonadaceae bacterium]
VAYVVILHLSPDHESRLAEVLQTTAEIPVTQVKETVKVVPNHVYVVSPNHHLGMNDGHIVVEQNVSVEERRAPIDIFFRTLAESRNAGAIAVILSGTGADGSMGLKRVKERGGVVFVQNPREAEFSEMPRNSIATDLVDAVLNAAEIPAKIIAYKDNIGTVEIQENPESRPENVQAALREILAILRVRTGHDFTNYKHPTVLRRIERRINVGELQNLVDYAVYIRDHTDEANALLKDLLISVTNFFRDKEAFHFLETEVVPRILQDKSIKDEIRVWVAGCATGEEAYSLAMLFAERFEGKPDAPSIQIFATDIDEAAIAHSREGFYTLVDVADVSPERLRRFFTREGEGFRVRRELREMILFAKHNLLKDAPFSHLDLVTCRNLLIYFNGTAQERAMETFHFALNPGAFLFLGTSESVDGAGDLYAPINKEFRIYQSRHAASKIAYPVPEAPNTIRYSEPKPLPRNVTARIAGISQEHDRLLERISFGDLHQQLLEQYAPPSIVVNENYDIVHLSERAGRFLQIAGGEPSKNLLHLVRPELRLELRTALFQAVQRRANVVAANLKVQTGGHAETINIQVRPVLRFEDTARGFLLVIFEPSQENADGAETATEKIITSDEPLARRFEEELERTKSQLRTSVEQYEIQTEELRASNEELQAMNEELRSTAEELETSREELQSVNEELMTVNQELKIKIEELSTSNNDFKNLLHSTDIGTIFLDRSLRVKMFTPPAREVFNLIDADINRPLADITTKMDFADLHRDVEQVLETLHTVEREFETDKGRWYLLRVFPYRTTDDKINGAVATFVDITTRVHSEQALHQMMQSRESQRRIFDTTLSTINDFAYIFDKEGRFVYSNQPLLDLLGVTLDEIIGKNFFDLNYPQDLAARHQREIQQVFETGKPLKAESTFTAPDGATGIYEYIFNPVLAADGSVESIAGSTRDITERKRREMNSAFLADITADLSSLSTADEILQTVGAKLGAFFNISLCAFTDVDEASDTATITHDWHREDVRSLVGAYRMDEFLSGEFQRLSRAGEAFVVHDTLEDRRVDAKKYRALDVGAFVSLPIVRGGKWLYHIVMFDSKAHDWRADEIELMREITTRVWTSIERARAEEALRESEALIAADLAGMRRLYELQSKLSDQTDVEEAFRDILAVACDFTGTERGCVQFLSSDGERLEMFVWQGYENDSPFIEFFRYEGLEAGCEVARVQRQRMIIEDTEGFAGLEGTDAGVAAQADGIRASQSTPMSSRAGETIGVISTQFRQPHRPTDHELRLMDMLAWTAAEFLERHRANQAQREADARLQKAISTETVGVLFFSLDGGIQDANEAIARMTGYTRDELRNTVHWETLTPPEFRELTARTAAELAEKGEVAPYEKQLFRKDGSRWWGLFAPTRLSGSGLESQCVEFIIDITERKKAEQALSKSDERLRLLIESVSDYAIFTVTKDNLIESWNTGAERTFGWKENEIVGKSNSILFTPEDRERGVPLMEMQCAAETGKAEDERWHIRKDGSRFYASGVMQPLRDGGINGFVKICRDQTEKIEAEKAVQDKEMLQRLITAQEDERKRIARDLHDELGQQLTALRLKLEATRKICEEEEICGKIDEMQLIAKQIDADVDFLAWELRPAALDDLGLVAALENYVREWSHHAGVTAEFHASKSKKLRLAPEVETNLYRITQEALNNTHKHAEAGRATVMLEKRDDLIVLIVEDDGKGFKPKDKKNR